MLLSHPREPQIYKETVPTLPLPSEPDGASLATNLVGSNWTRQDYHSYVTEPMLSSVDKTTEQKCTRGERTEINTPVLRQLPPALASKPAKLYASAHSLGFPSVTTEQSSPDNKGTAHLATGPFGSSSCIIKFSLSCGWTKISDWKHDWVLGIKLK